MLRVAPVSTYTVAHELGQESEAMVRRVYVHLGEVRHRSQAVEYRVAQLLSSSGTAGRSLGSLLGALLRRQPKLA